MRRRKSIKIIVAFSISFFLLIVATTLLAGILGIAAYRFDLFTVRQPILLLVSVAIVSVTIGTLLSTRVGCRGIRPIIELKDATKEIANGNYNIRITEYSRMEELREMAQNFNRMAMELGNTEILRKDFVENVSHEFKTPIATIEGYATILQKDGLSEEKRKEYLDKIVKSAVRLSSLSGNILLLSQIENQEIGIVKERYDLDEQIRESILFLEKDWEEKHLELEIDLEEIQYHGNKELMGHVWQNLISNAIKFSDVEGVIKIELKRKGTDILFTIVDYGIGMSEEVQKRIFERFYQGDRSRSTKGNGLGLALVKRIIYLHYGEIRVTSEDKKGSTFEVVLKSKEE